VTEPQFLDVDDVLAIHAEALAAFGGSSGVRDAGLLASAVAVPRATFGGELLHEDLFAMAAAYAFHIAQNQPFVDGNKRTAILAAIVFLDLNGVEIPEATDDLYDAMIGIAERRLGKDDVAAVLRRLGVPR
jgi:death-on-curing protein